MQFLDITLDVLLSNPDIEHVSIGNIWYFKHSDVNQVYDNNFKFINVKLVKKEVNRIKMVEKYISYPTIEEHVNFAKRKVSFEQNIDKALGLNPKR